MSNGAGSSNNTVSFKQPASDHPVKYCGSSYELYVRVEVEPNLDDVIYWTVVLQFDKTDPETLENESHNVAKIEEDKVHDGVHIHRNYRRDQVRDFDIGVDAWFEAMEYLTSNSRRFFESYADSHL